MEILVLHIHFSDFECVFLSGGFLKVGPDKIYAARYNNNIIAFLTAGLRKKSSVI